MLHSDISDRLVLICDAGQNGRPLGTGFIVNEFGYFITAYHVIKRVTDRSKSPKDSIICKWKRKEYRIQYIESLLDSKFYDSLKNEEFPNDLAIFQLRIPNKSLRVDHLPVLTFDMNKKLSTPIEVSFSGFNCETAENDEDPNNLTIELLKYEEKNGLWSFKGKDTIWHGYSGSPVLHPELGEVMGVVIRLNENNLQTGYVQSIHMLIDSIKSCDCDCEHFFRSPFSLYGEYHKGKCRSFEEEEWPYAIDKKDFVEAFDFKINRFSLKKEHGKDESNEYIIPFVVEQLKEHPVFCVGYYGMGKTTISKFLFTDYSSCSTDEHPVFISFRDAELPQMSSDHWNDYVARIICQDFKKYVEVEPDSIVKDELLLQYFKHFVNHNKVALIFDGIDEATFDKDVLIEFARWLKSLSCNYFLTSRMEFYAFFDVFDVQMENQSNLIVELKPWRKKQWRGYTKKLIAKYPEKHNAIKSLRKSLDNRVYGTLPERPLFLKMISDQELDNKTELEDIPIDLKENRSVLYNRYIRWKIIDDWTNKRGIYTDMRKIDFLQGSFRLFRNLANIEYEKSIPKRGAVELLGLDIHDKGSYLRACFSFEDIRKACDSLGYIKQDFIKYFEKSTFFSMIRCDIREKKDTDWETIKEFRFSHKSFCEYLVGYNLANSIFTEKIDNAICGREWNFYQTHEVSKHFQDEIERINSADGIKNGLHKPYVQNAFEKESLSDCDLLNYSSERSERLEQILYYTGKLKIESPKIIEFMKEICSDPKKVHDIYYRTAHISLSMVKGVDYCVNYIEHLIESFNKDKKAFQCNTDIQINYYGKANLLAVLKEDIDKFINKGNLKGIIPLEIFSYFTCIQFDETEVGRSKKYLGRIKKTCIKYGHNRMAKIMDEILLIFESISRVN